MQQQQHPHLLSLPSGLLLKHCSPHLSFPSICNLTSTCKEARMQSPDWKQFCLAKDGIHVSIGMSEKVWKGFYCTRNQRDEDEMATLLIGKINTFVLNEIAVYFEGHTPLAPFDRIAWMLERDTYLQKALQECGYMSTRMGRFKVQTMLLYSGDQIATRISSETPNLPADGEQIEQRDLEERIIASVPIMLHNAMVRLVPFVLGRFVVDEETGAVGV